MAGFLDDGVDPADEETHLGETVWGDVALLGREGRDSDLLEAVVAVVE